MADSPSDSIDMNDRTVFDSFIEEYYAPMFVFAVRIIKNSHAAEDIVQDAFANLWTNRKKVNDRIYARNFLYTVVRNSSVDYFRMLKKQQKSIEYQIPVPEDFSAGFIRAETLKLLHEAIGTLPPRTREIIQLTLNGKKQEEIAEQMGITVATVKLQKAEGIKKLRKILGPFSFLLIGL